MDFITKFKHQLAIRGFFAVFVPSLLSISTAFVCMYILRLDPLFVIIAAFSVGLSTGMIASWLLHQAATEPLITMEKIVAYAAHSSRGGTAPATDRLPVARQLVEAMSREIYDLASNSAGSIQTTETSQSLTSAQSPQMIELLQIPIIGIAQDLTVTVANKSAGEYFDKPLDQIIGRSLYDVVSFSFQQEETFDDWLQQAKGSSVTATKTWERVRHVIDQDHSKQFDLAASFSSGNSSGTETMLAIFDRTNRYNRDDQEVSFVALAVHELRTPITIMRGYIEVFEDELGPTLSSELTDFMHKMHASAQQLSAFVSNILNVARVEEDQLSLRLRQEDWATILKTAVQDLELRARVHGKHIELNIAENLPPAAADRISAHEVINNLVDNAIKYSDKADKIVITSQLNSDGLIETSVQDFGIGIPSSVMPELFQKFHRSHKSRVQIGGTGLGLYLCKALVTAHGGNIWVRSKEGEGSIFSFTIMPFDKISKEQIAGEDGIIRGAHGWIKNHSLYRN